MIEEGKVKKALKKEKRKRTKELYVLEKYVFLIPIRVIYAAVPV